MAMKKSRTTIITELVEKKVEYNKDVNGLWTARFTMADGYQISCAATGPARTAKKKAREMLISRVLELDSNKTHLAFKEAQYMDYRTARNIIRLRKRLLAQRNETAELEVEFRITRRTKYGSFVVQAFLPSGDAYYGQWFDKWDREYRLWEFIQNTCQNYRWYYRTKVRDND